MYVSIKNMWTKVKHICQTKDIITASVGLANSVSFSNYLMLYLQQQALLWLLGLHIISNLALWVWPKITVRFVYILTHTGSYDSRIQIEISTSSRELPHRHLMPVSEFKFNFNFLYAPASSIIESIIKEKERVYSKSN